MKNFLKIYYILWIVLALIFNVVAFINPGEAGEFYRYNMEFFIPIVIVDIFFLLQLFLAHLSLKNFRKKTKNNFEELSVLIKNAVFLITLLLVCVIIQIFPAIPKWINPISALLVFIINYFVVSKNNDSIKQFIEKIISILSKRVVKLIIAPATVAVCIMVVLLLTIFIPNYKYNKAISLVNCGEFSAACSEFYSINNYKDSKAQINSIVENNPALSFYIAKIGDTVKYGSYEQDDNIDNGKEAMEWTVIDIKGNKLLLINNYCIEKAPYHSDLENITWADCSLRQWLNNEFISTAFTELEQERIDKTRLTNHKNPSYRAPIGGKNTTDRVFILSYNEAKFYLKTDDMVNVKATKYVEQQLAHVSGETGNALWWLRTPGAANTNAATNHFVKQFSLMGYQVNHGAYTVRPCIWIEL